MKRKDLDRIIDIQLRRLMKLLQGEFREGDTIRVDADAGGYTFARVVTGEPVAA